MSRSSSRVTLPEISAVSGTLPPGVSVDSVALMCRQAGLEFLRGSTHGWTKRDLALWLAGPYAGATRNVKRGYDRLARRRARAGGMGEDMVLEWLSGAAFFTSMLLQQLAGGGQQHAYVRDAMDEEFVLPFEDELGTVVWVPVDVRDMRLKDRVRSLFVADCLNQPHEYAQTLSICARCGDVTFDEHARRTGACFRELAESAVKLQDASATNLVGAAPPSLREPPPARIASRAR